MQIEYELMWYPVKTSWWIKRLFPNLLWSKPSDNSPVLYLTFDDGPIPEVTPWVLEQLKIYDAKATFFCIGRNVQRHPEIYQQLLEEGHSTGNHTYNHYNGWKYGTAAYMNNVQTCADWVDSPLFRPPYGRLRPSQLRQLRQGGYQTVLWDVIVGDFDIRIDGEKCWQRALRFSENGSILVMHDSKKAWPRLEYCLPKLLAHFYQQGFQFKSLTP